MRISLPSYALAISLILLACGAVEKSPEEFGQHFFELLEGNDTTAALQYKFGPEDAAIVAEKLAHLLGNKGMEYPSNERFLSDFKDSRDLFLKEQRPYILQRMGLDQNTPIEKIEYTGIKLGKERVFGKELSTFQNSYINVLVNGQHKANIRLENVWKINGKWKIMELD